MTRSMWRIACLLALLAFPAHALPKDFVVEARGQFTAGGLVVLRLKPETRVFLDGAELAQTDGLAVLGFDRDAPATAQLTFTRGAMRAHHDITLTARQFDEERIDGLPPALVTPPPEALERIRRQAAAKRAARETLRLESDFAAGFRWPLKGRVSGVYGSRRFYNGIPRRPHYGLDIAAPAGTPVVAAASGRITLAAPDMYFEGGLVFIDHGLRLTSAYLHLKELKVNVGEAVAAGQVIGTVGSTGRSTGPHLDWRVFWNGRHIDPSLLVSD